jgi:PTS system cellobiose-specific IIB component
MLVKRMQKAASNKNISADIVAVSTADMYEVIDDADVILLGPQARYMLEEVKKAVKDKGIPVEVINQKLYGTMDGDAVLKMALELVKSS